MNTLKKICLALTLFTAINSGHAQTSTEQGDVLINPSLTLGWYNFNYGLNQVNIVPPVGLNIEYMASDYVGIGIEGIYSSRKYEDFAPTEFSSSYAYSYKAVQGRLSFHYLDFVRELIGESASNENLDKLDLYAMVSTGLQWTNTTRTWRDGSLNGEHQEKLFESDWIVNYAAGFRYYLSRNFGAFTEIGRNSMGWVKLGITLKL